MITKTTTKSREEWLKLRGGALGGSDAAAVIGLNSFKSPYALWAEKTGKVPPFEGNLTTEVGTYLEKFVAQKFTEVTGKKVRKCNQSILNDKYPFAIANIDREVVGEDAGLEIKTTSELNLKKFKGGEYPANYYVQCVHYMAITGKKKWYLAVLIGNKDFKIFEIERDEDEIDALMKSEEAFWEHVRLDKPPAADGNHSTSETLSTIYKESLDGCVDLFGYESYVKQYIEISKQIKELESMKTDAANQIKAYMREVERGVTNNYKVSWKNQEKKSFNLAKFTKDYPEMDLSGYFTFSKSRIFRVSENK